MPTYQDFVFIADNLALDLVNTQRMRDGEQVDDLEDYHALVSWLEQAHVVDAAQAKAVLKKWGSSAEGKRAHEQAHVLRGALRTMAEYLAQGKSVPQSSLNAINDVLSYGVGHHQLVRVRGGFEQRLQRTCDEAKHLLVPVAEAAAGLLCHGDLSLIKKCGNPLCILYFHDTTKNHARRWCSMAECGNRMKAAAHYRRLHSA